MTFSLKTSYNRHISLLLMIWCMVQCWLLYNNGINTEGESLRYIREAHLLQLHGHYSSPVYFFYSLEILLISLSQLLFNGYELVIALHWMMNLLALIILFRYLRNTCKPAVAITACLLLLMCIPYQLYNNFLYTESIFFSLTLIYTIFILKTGNIDKAFLFKSATFLLLLCITRPTGLFFVAGTCLFIFFKTAGQWPIWIRYGALLLLSIGGLMAVNQILQGGGGYDSMKPFKEAHVICDVPTGNIESNEMIINAPLINILRFVSENPGTFIKLSIYKSTAFFGLYRSYYTPMHNALMMIFFFSLYMLIIFRWIKERLQFLLADIFILSVIFFFWLTVIFSCDEWHNRFFLTIAPQLIILAASNFRKKPS